MVVITTSRLPLVALRDSANSSPSSYFLFARSDIQNPSASRRCRPIPFCRHARKSPRHPRQGAPRTASLESAPRFFLTLLCAFQGDAGGNPYHSILAGQRQQENLVVMAMGMQLVEIGLAVLSSPNRLPVHDDGLDPKGQEGSRRV